jgi:hypothetical protein
MTSGLCVPINDVVEIEIANEQAGVGLRAEI